MLSITPQVNIKAKFYMVIHQNVTIKHLLPILIIIVFLQEGGVNFFLNKCLLLQFMENLSDRKCKRFIKEFIKIFVEVGNTR